MMLFSAPARAQTLTRAPAVLTRVEPVYPAAARAAGLAASVTMQVDLDATGKVVDVRLVKGAGQGFDEAALAALRQFTFSPAELDGGPAAVQIEYTLNFSPPPVALAPAPPAPPEWPLALQGRVVERATRVPIVGGAVRVKVEGHDLPPALTDAEGRFALRAPPGTAAVEVLNVAHRPFTTTETLRPGEVVQVTYHLLPTQVGAFEAVVRGQREHKEVTRHTLQRDELQAIPGSFGDALRALLNLPGLARTPYTTGGLVVRGALGTDTGTYFDGVQLPIIFHFAAGPSVVNGEFVDRIDFSPSGFGARYGRAIGGILDVESRPARAGGVHGSAKVDLLDAGVYVSAPLGEGLAASFALRRSYIDGVLALALHAAHSSVKVVPVYYDYQARLDWRPKGWTGHSFKATFIGSDDRLAIVAKSTTGPSFEVGNHIGFQRLMGEWRLTRAAWQARALAFFGFDQTSLGAGDSAVDFPAAVVGLRQDTELSLHPSWTLRTGLDWLVRRQILHFSLAAPLTYRPFPGAEPDVPVQKLTSTVNELDFGEWVELEARTPFGLQVIPSFRLDAFYAFGQTQLIPQPRLSLRQTLHLAPQPTVLKASAGWYSQLPTAQASSPAFGNPHLPAQRALHLALGANQSLTSSLSAEVTGFWSRRRQLAVPTDRVNVGADGHVVPEYWSASAAGEAYGLELLVRQALTRNLFGWAAYTLSWSRQRDAPGMLTRPTTYDERHILTLVGQYRFASGWQLGGRFRLVTSAPDTRAVASTYLADDQTYVPLNGPIGAARGPIFHQLDLRVDRVWAFNDWQLGVYLDVQNVYNRLNQDFTQYDYRYRGTRSIPDIPLLPTLGVKGVF